MQLFQRCKLWHLMSLWLIGVTLEGSIPHDVTVGCNVRTPRHTTGRRKALS